jgi:hypothetical protein
MNDTQRDPGEHSAADQSAPNPDIAALMDAQINVSPLVRPAITASN